MSYQTPSNTVNTTIEIKKSEFITFAFPITDREKAMFHVKQLREKYPDARHHCWAYIVGDPHNTTSAGFDDDGEPSGTAGKPILNVLQHKAIGNVIIIVVRYFGGIKLGAGGLTRAYSSSAQYVVDKMVLTSYVATTNVKIQTDYASENKIRYFIDELQGTIDDVTYGNDVIITVTIEDQQIDELKSKLSVYGTFLNKKTQ